MARNVAKAVQLSDTEAGAIYVFDATRRELRLRATYGMDQGLIHALPSSISALKRATSPARLRSVSRSRSLTLRSKHRSRR